MGRRKIEIKAIKDDRNRSVTFLKRKGGLFKKAHELSVLCSVDVAVIIFGNNKKLYEYSSSDMGEILSRYNYYGSANEHKGPADFNGKGGMDDEDDDDGGGGSPHSQSVESQMMPPQYQPHFSQVRLTTQSGSPPVPNGAFQGLPPRQHTPQPGPGSRPPSRGPSMTPNMAPNMNARRSGSSLGPNAGHSSNGYGYMPNPAIYNPQTGQQIPNGLPPHLQSQTQQQGHNPPYSNYPPAPPAQVQQIYGEDQRRSSMPPNFPYQRPVSQSPQPQHRPPPPVPQEHQPQMRSQQQPMPQQHPRQNQQQEQEGPERRQLEPTQQPTSSSSLMPEPVKRMSIKSRSIFTPIDESRSILSQHWASSTSQTEPPGRSPMDLNIKQEPPTSRPASVSKGRHISMSGVSGAGTPPSRQNSVTMAGGKRPILKVQIPDEPSDDEASNTATSASPTSPTTKRAPNGIEPHTGVVLPPPSPSASTIMSAGATGPPNPFARPPPPQQSNSSSSISGGIPNSSSHSHPQINNNNLTASNAGNIISNHHSSVTDTPVSALPSRFMTNDFLPSPSSFYPEWNYRGSESNTLPSPLNFATPVVGSGPSFLREEEKGGGAGGGAIDIGGGNAKRKSPDFSEEARRVDDARLKRLKH